ADTRKVQIGLDGTVSIFLRDENLPEALGSIQLARFQNPAGLTPIGKNLFLSTPASGNAIVDAPGSSNMGSLTQGFLERSNVSLVEEMVNMITAQRAYEVNSKAIQSADEMLKNTNNLVR
ncbi:MAG TPA: flagellar basal body rod protein FlgG, partial [Deltaproteobacteria bacterium]|nr:flagellar basal body rod protein FlgG [Deltaproteobacteria bacterium]